MMRAVQIEHLLSVQSPSASIKCGSHRLQRHVIKGIAVHKVVDRLDLVRVQVRDERELINALHVAFVPVRKVEVQVEL